MAKAVPNAQGKIVAPKPPKPDKAMVALAKRGPEHHLALVLWHMRDHFPEFAVTVPAREAAELEAALAFNEQQVSVLADPVKNARGESYLVIRLADRASGDRIVAQESTQQGLDRANEMREVRRARDMAASYVATARQEMAVGVWSQQTLNNLCEAVLRLAGALPA